MRRSIATLLCLCLLSGFSSLLIAQTSQEGETNTHTLRNEDILRLHRARVAPEVIISKIKNSRCNFDVFVGAIADLKQRGVADSVLQAMIEAPIGPPLAKRKPSPSQRSAANETTEDPEGDPVSLPEGEELTVTPTEEINSRYATEGQTVTFRVVNDVLVNGKTVVAEGAIARGMVTNVENRGMLGKAGKLGIRIDSVKAVDGQKVRLRAAQGKEGGSNTGKVIALSVLVSPLFLLMRGNTARIKPGQNIQVYVDESKAIQVPTSSAKGH